MVAHSWAQCLIFFACQESDEAGSNVTLQALMDADMWKGQWLIGETTCREICKKLDSGLRAAEFNKRESRRIPQ